jgi:hypothetical protein
MQWTDVQADVELARILGNRPKFDEFLREEFFESGKDLIIYQNPAPIGYLAQIQESYKKQIEAIQKSPFDFKATTRIEEFLTWLEKENPDRVLSYKLFELNNQIEFKAMEQSKRFNLVWSNPDYFFKFTILDYLQEILRHTDKNGYVIIFGQDQSRRIERHQQDRVSLEFQVQNRLIQIKKEKGNSGDYKKLVITPKRALEEVIPQLSNPYQIIKH